MSVSILIIEDEENVRQGLEEIIGRAGYAATGVDSGEEALLLLDSQKFDLALLDLKLKGIDGIQVLKELRQKSPDTVAIVLTAHATLETAVEALRYGAHDYLFKPCTVGELRESIRRGLLQRSATWQRHMLSQLDDLTGQLDHMRSALTDWQDSPPPIIEEELPDQKRFLRRGELVVDYMRHLVTLRGHLLDLSLTEYNLLTYLLSEAPKVITPEELIDQVQDYDMPSWDTKQLVRQYIYRLRQKIFESTGREDVIFTVRGVGYKINEEIL